MPLVPEARPPETEPLLSRLHSPSSLEASYAGLDQARRLRGPATPPPTPPGTAAKVALFRDREVRPAPRPGQEPLASAARVSPEALRSAALPCSSFADRLQLVEEEKRELRRQLQASTQRAQNLEQEQQGLKTSLLRMEKLLGDLVVTSSPPQEDLRAVSPGSFGRPDFAWSHSRRGSPAPQGFARGMSSPVRGVSYESRWESPRRGTRVHGLRRESSPKNGYFGVSALGDSFRRESSPKNGYFGVSALGDSFRRESSPHNAYFGVTVGESLRRESSMSALGSSFRESSPKNGYGSAFEGHVRSPSPKMQTAYSTVDFFPSSVPEVRGEVARDRYSLLHICQNLPSRLSRGNCQ
ncbi:unnamed protein product [Effrenium voratum]|nr:unnamed protein product [Effrenium voratum]